MGNSDVHIANTKAQKLIEFAQQQEPVWKGKAQQEDDWLHIVAERDHPKFGHEQVELWWEGNSMNRPPEYSRNGQVVIEKNSAEIRRRLAGLPTISTKNAFDGEQRRARKVGLPKEDTGPTTQTIKRQRLRFGPDSDDADILDGVTGRRVWCTSTIYPDFPIVEHAVSADRQHQPVVVRLDNGDVNVDYLSPFGFRSLRVNNIVRVR